MILCYALLCLLNVIPELWGYHGFYFRDATGLEFYTLEGLGADIMQKIRRATGYPIDSSAFSSVLSVHRYDHGASEHRPRRSKRGKKKKKDDSFFGMTSDEQSSYGDSNRFSLSDLSSSSGGKKWDEIDDESSGFRNEFSDGSEFTDAYYHQNEEEDEKLYKGLRKRNRAFLSKGYEDEYRKDETKKSDSFWDVNEQEGKWLVYGNSKKSREKSDKSEKGAKKAQEGKEGDKYEDHKSYEKKKEISTKAKKESSDSRGKEREEVEVKKS